MESVSDITAAVSGTDSDPAGGARAEDRPWFVNHDRRLPSPRRSAGFGGSAKAVPVERLIAIVDKLIKEVEDDSTVACETRNSAVAKLRILDNALLSGNLLSAFTFAQAWRQDAWSMMGAGVISPQLGSSIQNRLSQIQGRIDFSSVSKPHPPKHWKPLPSCDSSMGSGDSTVGVVEPGAAGLVGAYNPAGADPSYFSKVLLKTMLGKVPLAGFLLSAMVDLLWPQGVGTDEYGNELHNMFMDLVDQTTYNMVSNDLQGLGGELMDKKTGWKVLMQNWRNKCTASATPEDPTGSSTPQCLQGARELWDPFYAIVQDFNHDLPDFKEESGADPNVDYRIKLLPLFAQYENLYLLLLRDGVLLHPYWAAHPDMNLDDLDGDMAAKEMAAELDPSNAQGALSYVNAIYKLGVVSPDPLTKDAWDIRNAYIRNGILDVLDYRDMWKYQNPRAYPGGVPGGIRLTRMIYSDLVGYKGTGAMPAVPTNVAGPLKELTGWTKTDRFSASTVHFVGSLQATSAPLLGPAQSGAITGTPGLLVNHAHYFNLGALGPITTVNAGLNLTEDTGGYPTSMLNLYFAKGKWYDIGYQEATWAMHNFHYDGEVLATAQGIDYFDHDNTSGNVARGFVFGFRFGDSFPPAGQAIGVGSGWCLDLPGWTDNNTTQAVMHSCYVPPTPAQTWSYDPVLEQISVTNPAEWSPNNPTTSGKHCLDAKNGGTSAGTDVVINACDDGANALDADGKPILDGNGNPVISSQRWIIEAAGTAPGVGKITNRKSGLVLDAHQVINNVIVLQLSGYQGTAYQKWHAHDAANGEIHGIGSGKCVDTPSAAAGTQVQIYDCNGTAAQQWTYNVTNKELIYANSPSLCLEARGGGTAPDTPVQINACTGAPEQQWTLQGISLSVNQGGGGTITNVKSGLPLSVPHGSTTNNTLLNIDYANNTEAQQWSRTSSQGGGVYALGASGKCLDLIGSDVVVEPCANPLNSSQTWAYHPIAQTFTVDTSTGQMCLDATDSSVVVNQCNGTSPSQHWSRDFRYSTVTNVASGLVLDLAGTDDGASVHLTAQPKDSAGNLSTANLTQQWVWSLN